MRKILMFLLTTLLAILAVLTIKNGIHIGSLQVRGIEEIQTLNNDLTSSIQNVESKKEDYETTLTKLKTDSKSLQDAKSAYTNLVNISSESDIQEALQTKTYAMEYLWSKVGYIATKLGVTIKMDVSSNTSVSSATSGTDYKTLKFTVNGDYIAIEEFIRELEDDSDLEFTIDDFSMSSKSATFTVKDVKIKTENTGSTSTTSSTAYTDTTSQSNTANTASTSNTTISTSSNNTVTNN